MLIVGFVLVAASVAVIFAIVWQSKDDNTDDNYSLGEEERAVDVEESCEQAGGPKMIHAATDDLEANVKAPNSND